MFRVLIQFANIKYTFINQYDKGEESIEINNKTDFIFYLIFLYFITNSWDLTFNW